jgi:hypothetical protein
VKGYSSAYGGAGGASRGSTNTAIGAAGGAATATLNLTGALAVYAKRAYAKGGAGGTAYGTGTGGVGGSTTGHSDSNQHDDGQRSCRCQGLRHRWRWWQQQ